MLGLDELRELDNAYWFVPGEDAVTGRPAEDYVLQGQGAGRPRPLRGDAWPRCSSRSPDVVLNLDIKRTAPDVVAYEEATRPRAGRARPLRRRDRRLLLRLGDGRVLPIRTARSPSRPAPRRRPSSTSRLHAGEPPQDDIGRYVALQVPAALRPDCRRRRAVRRGRRTRAGSRCTSGRSTTPRRWSTWSASASTGSSPTSRRVLSAVLEPPRGELEGVRLSRGRSSASCRGWPSSSCGACASQFAWTQARQCSGLLRWATFRAHGWPFGSVGLAKLRGGLRRDGDGRMAWLLRDGEVLASVEVASSLVGQVRGLIGQEELRGGPAAPPHAVGPHDRDAVRDRRRVLDQGPRVIAVASLPPYRIGLPRRGGRSVLEAEAGAFERWGLVPGDRLEIKG